MAHALLSPSSASRWLACTPSARLEEGFPDKAGAAAAEGTLAHSLGELLISKELGLISKKDYAAKLAEIENDTLYNDDMFSHCTDYAQFVIETFTAAKNRTKDAVIFLEQKLDMTDYVPEGFGTGDVVIIGDGFLESIDLKYGKGIPVSAVENRQMMLYALGALRNYEFLYDIHTVRMTIYQPRLDNYSTFEMSVEELKKWAKDELKPKAALAFEGKGKFVPGKHCQFCKAKARCKALAEYNIALVPADAPNPDLLTDEEIASILDKGPMFTNWLNAVNDYALDEAVNKGKKWPGYKLVEGRSNRAYSDESKVAETLLKEGFKEDTIYSKKLLGITAMEKAITKKSFNQILTPLVIKPQGKPTLAPLDDKRPEYSSIDSAIADFADVEIN